MNFEASSDPPQEPVRYCHSEAKAEESQYIGTYNQEILRPACAGLRMTKPFPGRLSDKLSTPSLVATGAALLQQPEIRSSV